MFQPVNLVSLAQLEELVSFDKDPEHAYLRLDLDDADVDVEYFTHANDIVADIYGVKDATTGEWARGVYLIRTCSPSEGRAVLRTLLYGLHRVAPASSLTIWSLPLSSWISV